MRTLVLGLLILGISNRLIAQNYESLFGSNSTRWNITMGNLWGNGTDQHSVSGDTTINGNSYKIIGGYSIAGFNGYLREDTIQGKAWYRNNHDTTDFLIMDLELSVGDSMFVGGNWNPNPGYYFVDSVYTFNNRKHIRFDFELFFMNNTNFTLIEGISSNLGFRYQDIGYINNFNPELICSYKNGIQVFGTGQCIVSGLNEITNKGNINVYPNPFSDNVIIDVSQWKNEIIQFDIINSSGNILKSGEVNNSKFSVGNIGQYGNGTYFVIFHDKHGNVIFLKKIIKVSKTM
ncbi:T9SS type A sorting domain-containing protein [Aureispira]|nr:T9SS type A sorting domain-containing protein [Aureispira sp.]